MKITERDLEYLPRFWHSYSMLSDIAKAENMDQGELVCIISCDLSVFNDSDISRCWLGCGSRTLPSRLYDCFISEGIMIIEPGVELEFSLTDYGKYFKEIIDKEYESRQKHLEHMRERRTKRKARIRSVFVSLTCGLFLMVLGGVIAALLIR